MIQIRSWPLLWGSIACLLGVALGSLGHSAGVVVVLSSLGVLGLLGCLVTVLQLPSFRILIILLILVALGGLYGVVRTSRFALVTESVELRDVSVVVVSSGSVSGTSQRLFVDVPNPQGGQRLRVRATLRDTAPIRYGEVLLISGQLEPPRDSERFYETGYLRAHRSQGTLFVNSSELVGQRQGSPILWVLHDTQERLMARLHAIHLPERSLVAGIVLGEARLMPAWIEEAFRQTGTTHMVVASGANVAILAWMVEHVLAFAGLRLRVGLTSVLLLGFVVMTGGEASIVRAVLLYLILMLAMLLGRRVHLPTLVAVVALGMALHTPWIILFDASYQLSFVAVVGLLIFSEWLAARLPTWWLKEFLAPTLAAQVATLPILLFSFGQLSVVAPLVNLLTVPLVMPIMVGGIATIVLPWSRFIPWLTEGVAALLLCLVQVGARLPWASITTDTHRFVWSACALLIFAGLAWLRYRFPVVRRE